MGVRITYVVKAYSVVFAKAYVREINN